MFIKLGVAVALLRIAANRHLFVIGLWVLMAAVMIAALVFVVGIANICMCNGSCNTSTTNHE
jgi:hypothetical protein